ncbi:MAG: phage integrase N-terminal SAM-like domain-containing protein [Nanoarchaeota archaeon]
METDHPLRPIDFDKDLNELRSQIRSHGYTASTVRSYSFYIKDYLGWLGSLPKSQKAALNEHSMVRYAVHLKEDRKMGDSAVAQAFSAVSFYLRNVANIPISRRQEAGQPQVVLIS